MGRRKIVLYSTELRYDVKNLLASIVYLLVITEYRLQVIRLKVTNETLVTRKNKYSHQSTQNLAC